MATIATSLPGPRCGTVEKSSDDTHLDRICKGQPHITPVAVRDAELQQAILPASDQSLPEVWGEWAGVGDHARGY